MSAMNFAAGRCAKINVKKGEADADRGDRFDERADRFHRPNDAHRVVELDPIAAPKRLFLMLFARE